VAVAWERFRRHALRLCGLRPGPLGSAELATVIRRRFPVAGPTLETDLAACEEASWGETIEPRDALKLIQALHDHEHDLLAAAKPGSHSSHSTGNYPNQQERAS
jgi:hypothetical protein